MKAFLWTFGALILCSSVVVRASTVLQVSFDELVHSSEFIFEGRVIDRRVEMDQAQRIHTMVQFEILDVLKGTSPGRTIVLRYLGGAVGDIKLEVDGIVPPEPGERGVYFVESLSNPPVHPLYGWDQGHFMVVRDASDQVDRMFSRNRTPIIGFEPKIVKPAGISTGIAAGVVMTERSRVHDAMTLGDFKKKVQEIAGQK